MSLAAETELFHNGDDSYASFNVDGHRETWPLHCKAFKDYLCRAFYGKCKKTPNEQSLRDALGVLSGRARFDGSELPTAIRLARQGDNLYVDLCDTGWNVVEVTAVGWRIIPSVECPVRFVRRKGMLALPAPVPGGSVDELRPLLNVPDSADWTLIVGWLMGALHLTGPYSVLDLDGEQGSGKTSAAKMLRALVDPNEVPLRRPPREERDLVVAARNARIVAYDNVTSIPSDLSNGLSSLATGAGFGQRRLYTDDEETLFNGSRPILLNGIGSVVTKSDLSDRAIRVTLPMIPDDRRREEADLWPMFETVRPRVLGALLTAASTALRNLPTVKLPYLPRMADFARWVTAAESAFGWAPLTFLKTYAGNRAAASEAVLEASAIGPPLMQLVGQCGGRWQGSSTDLLNELETIVDDNTRRRKNWPKTSSWMGRELRGIAPNLRRIGVEADFGRGSGAQRCRLITFTRTATSEADLFELSERADIQAVERAEEEAAG